MVNEVGCFFRRRALPSENNHNMRALQSGTLRKLIFSKWLRHSIVETTLLFYVKH